MLRKIDRFVLRINFLTKRVAFLTTDNADTTTNAEVTTETPKEPEETKDQKRIHTGFRSGRVPRKPFPRTPKQTLPKLRYRLPDSLFTARNWRTVESLYLRDSIKWEMEELRFAWKRCVHAHLDDETHQLVTTAPCSRRTGRQFLQDLMKTTLTKLEKNNWEMTGVQARDIGWSAGKQWFMDRRLVDPIQTGIINGVVKDEIKLYEAAAVAWAIANSGQYPVRIFETFQKDIMTIFEELNLQHCTNILWAMAVCGYHPGESFMRIIADIAASMIETDRYRIIPQAISDLVWSLGRLNLTTGHERLVHLSTAWAYDNISRFSPEEMLTAGMGLAMVNSLGLEDMRTIATAFREKTRNSLIEVYVDQFIALTLLFPFEDRRELHETAFGKDVVADVLGAHHDRQAQITVQMKNNKFLRLISRQLDKVAKGQYEIGTLTEDRNLALEILVRGENDTYSVMPVYPMSRSRNNPEIELGEVRIAQRLIEAQGIKFGGFLEWITPEDNDQTDVDEEETQDAV